MSGWKSRWSWLRFVKTAAAQWIPSARRSSSACEEISIAQAASPPSSISRNVRWRSIASGVVRWTGARLAAHDRRHGAEQPGLDPRRLEHRPREPRRGRLAARAGDADHAQLGGRVAVEARGGVGHGRAHVLDPDLGDAEAERAADDERGRPARDRVGREVMAVAREAGDAEEQRAWLHHAVVEGEAGDLDVVRAVAEQLAQRHRAAVYGRSWSYSRSANCPAGCSRIALTSSSNGAGSSSGCGSGTP